MVTEHHGVTGGAQVQQPAARRRPQSSLPPYKFKLKPDYKQRFIVLTSLPLNTISLFVTWTVPQGVRSTSLESIKFCQWNTRTILRGRAGPPAAGEEGGAGREASLVYTVSSQPRGAAPATLLRGWRPYLHVTALYRE